MLQALITLAASDGEPSKTAFYIAGGLLAVYAVAISALGITRMGNFPASTAQARGVMALSAVLVALAMGTAVLTG